MTKRTKQAALIVGNSAYPGQLLLSSPVHDVNAMRDTLKELGYEVTCEVDQTFKNMDATVAKFVNSLSGAPAAVGLFYYSGHGLQIDGENYIVPIDFDQAEDANSVNLVSVQRILEEISAHCDVRIVLLDACRNGGNEAVDMVRAKSVRVAAGKSIYVGGESNPVLNMAEMKAASDTFIAFAAASGDAAYDGEERSLSPFTEAFVKHMDAVDLPLSNLTSRVRQEVSRLTRGAQKTWDQSSLRAPYFFNPGSSLLFTGNLMALIGLFLALVPYTLVLYSASDAGGAIERRPLTSPLLAGLLPLLSLAILLWGMNSVYERLRGNFVAEVRTHVAARDHLVGSLQKGFLGGYLGSFVAALASAVPYYFLWVSEYRKRPTDLDPPGSIGDLVLEIAIASALIGCVLGFLSLFFSRLKFDQKLISLATRPTWQQTLVGSAVGGTLAGLLTAPFLTWYFGRFSRPEYSPDLLLPGSVVGAAVFIFAVVNFDFERLGRRRILASVAAVPAAIAGGAAATVLIFGPLYLFGVVELVTNLLRGGAERETILLVGGAIYGMPVGAVLGCVIGTAILLTQRWSGKEVIVAGSASRKDFGPA
jgi:hypothetical protein